MRRSIKFAAAGLALVLAGSVQAQTWPTKPMVFLNPFPAGGGTDTFARPIAARLGQTLGEQAIIENQGGAGGTVGATNAARRAPDGYNWFFGAVHHTIAESLYTRLSYSLEKDFEPITILSTTPSFLSVHPSVPARSVRELLSLAKSRPGALNYAGAGVGTNPHIAGELFNYLGKVNLQAVQFKGGGPALIAAISGEVGVAFSGIAGAVGFVQTGRLRALGVSSLKPVAALPGVPTIAESGLPGYEFVAWFVLAAPKGTPREIILALNDHFRKAMTFPDTIRRFEAEGLDVVGGTPEQAAATMESELKKWAVVIRERGMKAD